MAYFKYMNKKHLLLLLLAAILVLFNCTKKSNPIPSGCTNPFADNYNASAITDDGSCLSQGKPIHAETIVCLDKSPGDEFEVNGVTYLVVTNQTIKSQLDAIDANQNICTSLVTDMADLFLNNSTFNQAIGNWDTSNVSNMSGMFRSDTQI